MTHKTIFKALHHASVIVNDLNTSLYFYCHILGVEHDLNRPQMSFEGAWLHIGEQQIHLLCLEQTEQTLNQPEHAGRDRHLAIYVNEIDTLKERLITCKIPFTMSYSGRNALFCRDPDGNGLEFIVS